MDRSEIIIVPVSAIEVIVFAQYMIRLRVSEIILFIPGNIASLFVERERMEFAAMADIVRAGITELCISGRPITSIHPLVIRLIDGRSIMPGCRGSKISLVFRQIHFHSPKRTGHQVVGRDVAAYTAIVLLLRQVIDRCAGGRRMAYYTEIKFDTARSPGSAHGNITKLHHMVIIDKFLSGGLIHSSPYLPSDLREKRQADIVVFKRNDFPLFIYSFGRETVETEIGIKQVGRIGHRIGVGERVGFYCLQRFRYNRLLLC